ncbi:beta-lactamase family protein, partial [Paracoccaceae bacterium]|nr:beta-lactamase family protein [Paracoccaceae bacterium]
MKLNLDKVNDKLLALKIPFADYGVVNSDEVLSEGTFKDPLFRKVPHPKDRIYRMASMTKPITAYLALVVLHEEGINLNDEVGTFLPEIDSLKICRKRNNVIEYIKNDVPITFHQLLNCTSGHVYEHHDPIISDLISKKLLVSMKDGDEAFLEAPLVFKPGSKWGYGISYGWLGKALCAITKKSLNNILDKYLCQPLQLKNTSFELKMPDREKLVPVYIQESDGSYSCISSKINLGLNTFQYG